MRWLVASPDGRLLLTHNDGHVLRLWDGSRGEELLRSVGHVGQTALTVSASAKLAAWATPNPDAVHSLTLTGFPPSPATRIADLQLHHRAILFDLAQNEVRFIVSGRTKAVEALALSADGSRLASGDSIGIIKLWDAATGNALLSMEAHRGGVESLAFHPSGLQMASTGADETVRIWWGE